MIGFGQFSTMKGQEIISLEDSRLIRIDPTSEGFYDEILQCKSDDQNVKLFIKAVREVKAAQLQEFWRPNMDPTEEDGEIYFASGEKPTVGRQFNSWEDDIGKMRAVQGRKWAVGSDYQYYADLVDLINSYVKDGCELEMAILKVVKTSEELSGTDAIFKNDGILKNTGCNCVYGRYDLLNTCKLLKCSNGFGYWMAGNCVQVGEEVTPLADMKHLEGASLDVAYAVGWPVLM